MKPGITIDATEFNAALREYVRVTQRTIAYCLNKKAFYIALKAFSYSPVADDAAIRSLGIDFRDLSKRGKQLKRRKNIYIQDRLRAVYVGLLRKRGKLQGAKITEGVVRTHFARRLAAIGYVKSGWSHAIKRLGAMVGEVNEKYRKIKAGKQARGIVVPAKASFESFATIGNLAKLTFNLPNSIERRMLLALQRAFNEETAETVAFIAREMQKDADKVNAR